MKTTILALALAALCAHQALASLGETEPDLIKRYGAKTGSFISESGRFSTLEFEYLDYHVTVTVLDGASARETFSRKDKKPLDPVELDTFLAANALGSKWDKKLDQEDATVWVLESHRAFAGYYKSDKNNLQQNSLTVKTDDMLAFEQALMRVQQQHQQQATARPAGTPDKKLQP